MPSRRLPNTIAAVLRTLRTARDTYKNTPNAGDRPISAGEIGVRQQFLTAPRKYHVAQFPIRGEQQLFPRRAPQKPTRGEFHGNRGQSAILDTSMDHSAGNTMSRSFRFEGTSGFFQVVPHRNRHEANYTDDGDRKFFLGTL